jgi:SMODS and SLOG-associating 2TM effector domain family 5
VAAALGFDKFNKINSRGGVVRSISPFFLVAAVLVVCGAVGWYLYSKYIAGAPAAATARPRIYQDVAKSKTIQDASVNAYSLYLIVKCDTMANCQFEAARRMQKKNMASTVSIVMLSLYAILFSLMPTFDKVPKIQENKDILSMISIFMSVFIIAFSLYEMLKRYDLRSALFLKSARRLSELRDEVLSIHLGVSPDLPQYTEIEKTYHKILNDNDDNHSRLDYDVVRVGKRELVGVRAVEVNFYRLMNVWMVPFLALLAPILIFYLYNFVSEMMVMFSPTPLPVKAVRP